MAETGMKKKVLSGLFWKYAERCCAQGVTFIVGIVLARTLTPDDYGLSSLSAIFINILTLVGDLGLGNALIQKKETDELDYNSVYYINLALNFVLYAIIYFAAPLGAKFYREPRITAMIRVSALTLIIGALFSMQYTIIHKKMLFRKFFYSTIAGTIVSSFVGIYMAVKGYGTWAIIGQNLSNTIISKIVLAFMAKWTPKLMFSLKRVKPLYKFGWKMMVSSAIDQFYNNMYSLLIGRWYTKTDLAYYNRGKQYPMYIIDNLNSSINSVLFPALSEKQENKEEFKKMVRRSIKTSTFLVFPCMAGLAGTGRALITLLITEKWLPALPFLWFSCFTYALWPVHTANLQAVKAIGRSDVFLNLEVVKKVYGVIILIVTLPFGLMAMMWGRVFSTILSSFVNASPNKKLIGYSYFEQVKDILPAFLLSGIMLVCVLAVELLGFNMWLTLLIQVPVGVIVYAGGAKLFKFESFEYLWLTVKELLPKRKQA
ncbi:MAG: lipopolysaccharide biosynthesis protein [Clostridia bacterium]|nr:lipopolysaccharide biosynthesis protein [Clostridia bacterium]